MSTYFAWYDDIRIEDDVVIAQVERAMNDKSIKLIDIDPTTTALKLRQFQNWEQNLDFPPFMP